MEQLPKDPMMLLSVVNTKLRDFYPSLDALCEDMEVDRLYKTIQVFLILRRSCRKSGINIRKT